MPQQEIQSNGSEYLQPIAPPSNTLNKVPPFHPLPLLPQGNNQTNLLQIAPGGDDDIDASEENAVSGVTLHSTILPPIILKEMWATTRTARYYCTGYQPAESHRILPSMLKFLVNKNILSQSLQIEVA